MFKFSVQEARLFECELWDLVLSGRIVEGVELVSFGESLA